MENKNTRDKNPLNKQRSVSFDAIKSMEDKIVEDISKLEDKDKIDFDVFFNYLFNDCCGCFKKECEIYELKNENLIAKISNYGTLIKKSLPIINENKDIIIYSLISRLSLGDTFAKTISRVPNSISYFNGKLLFEYFWNSFYLNNIYELNTEIKNGEKLRLTDIDKFYFQYFTLEQLNDETTVNLSFIESFYIDFGKVFSILAITIYGFLLGNIYYFFSNKLNIIFFVFFLFLLFPIYLQIEVGMQQVTNYTIKFLLFFLFFKAIIIKFYSKYV